MEKIKKFLIIGVLSLLVILFAVWSFCETSGSDSYEYQGYIVGIRNTSEGTIIETIMGDKTSEFMLTKFTKEHFEGELTELKEEVFIRLNTTRNSDSKIKDFSAYEGFSMEGKIVYMEGYSEPFILTIDDYYDYYMLYSLISSQDIQYPLQTGTQVKVYYQYPLNASTKTFVVDVIDITSDILSAPTEKEIAYFGRQGYTVAN